MYLHSYDCDIWVDMRILFSFAHAQPANSGWRKQFSASNSYREKRSIYQWLLWECRHNWGGSRNCNSLNSQLHSGRFSFSEVSNHPNIFNSVPSEQWINSLSIPIENNMHVQALELCWQPSTHTFHFTLMLPILKVISKQTILSTIAIRSVRIAITYYR